jgi:hypothetical protein
MKTASNINIPNPDFFLLLIKPTPQGGASFVNPDFITRCDRAFCAVWYY